MIRIAILEYEKETKDIIFQFARIFKDTDWVFRHYWKASVLAKACKEEKYQIFIFDEMFKSPRLESVFVHDNPNAIFIYVGNNLKQAKASDSRARIFYVEKSHLEEQLDQLAPDIRAQAMQVDLYNLNYSGVNVNLPYEEIYYMEKVEKMVFFHTKKGVFHQRINMQDLEARFSPFGFLRVHVSYIVNQKYITAWFKDEVELMNETRVPLSRAQRKRINEARKKD